MRTVDCLATVMLALTFVLATSEPSLAQVKVASPVGTPLALVLSVEGSISSKGEAVSGGTLLLEGDAVQLRGEARLRFSLVTSCSEMVVEGPGRFELSKGAVVLDGARLVASDDAPGCVLSDRVPLSSSSRIDEGTVVVRAPEKGRLVPRSGMITSQRRLLRWDGPLADGRSVLLMLARGEQPNEVLLEQEVAGGTFELPEELPLLPGAEYAWSLETSGLSPGPSLAGNFRVVEPAVASQLGILRERATNVEGWLRVAFFCEVHMLATDAAEAYAQVISRDPAAEGARQRLVELDLP